MSGPERFEPKIVAYVCNWCTYLGADLAGTARLEYPPNVRIIRLPCTGRIDTNLVVKAFEIGADAVLVSGCHPGDCHYTAGNYHAPPAMDAVSRIARRPGLRHAAYPLLMDQRRRRQEIPTGDHGDHGSGARIGAIQAL